MSSDGERLLARGATVILTDDVPRRVILDMEAMVMIEDICGSLTAYTDGLESSYKGKLVKSVVAGLTGGLSHRIGPEAMPRTKVTRLMRMADMQSYIHALDAAWEEAVPTTTKGKPNTSLKGSGAASSSRGKNSGGASPSTTGGRRKSSGA